MIDLSLVSGIAPDVWAAQGERAIVTALDLLARAKRAQEADQVDGEGRQTSG